MEPSQVVDRYNIMVVEDDEDLRDMLCQLFRSEGYTVASATDGADALMKLNSMSLPPRVIVLDWMMPRMGGARFCHEKRNDPRFCDIPVVLLTADGRLDEKVEQSGVAMGIDKPVDINLLLSAIQKFV
jgi:CheY-like chemotaxis protein